LKKTIFQIFVVKFIWKNYFYKTGLIIFASLLDYLLLLIDHRYPISLSCTTDCS